MEDFKKSMKESALLVKSASENVLFIGRGPVGNNPKRDTRIECVKKTIINNSSDL